MEQDCEKQLLFDLVLKLTPVLYLPGDYICKKGEVGTEMYILKQGQVEVVSADGLVLATLSEGSVFGEISLLALAGGNRRTADVRSKGFSNLFILSKEDFNAAMSDYPKAQKILKKKAVKLLHQNAKLQNDQGETEATEIIKEREGTPRLLKTVIQVVQPDSKVAQMLTKPSSKGKGKGKTSGGKDTEKNGQKGLELRPPQTLKTIKTMAHGENGEITLKIKSTVQSENSENSLKEEDELSTPFASPGSDVKPLLKQESRQESGLTKADSSSDSTDSGLPGTQEMTQDRHHDNLTLTVTDLTALSDQLDTAEQNTSVETTKTLPKRPNTAPVKSVRTTWSNPKSSSDTNITYLPNIPDCGEDTTTKNTITCRVDVHHEKSWSPSICGQAADKGIDNFAFIESFSHSSHLKEAAEAETEF
ncbi:cyclic nucleotide-gated cation channel-like [Lingula anatina]|uniref:Cyclic nucleotide-gated cation channel-like n=1 Tax=Lingula anatina TaxID=7574 RepID=A0A1S3I4S8_LINAN|nr:cyclic nucleotide-gated cation channel-like [Lingula anatina]|eukprot:XP_013393228.1 cyclic nucleotide-gated cation channel-like [Lingula anatina]